MRVLMATMQLDIGGAETHIVELSKALARRGIEIIVASNGGAYEAELVQAGIRHIKVPFHSKNPNCMRRAYQLLKQILFEYEIDVVHAHARIPAFLCGQLHKRYHFRFVTTAHWVFNTRFPYNLLTTWGDRSLAVSDDIKTYLVDNYGIDPEHIRVTMNGIDLDKFSKSTDYSAVAEEFDLKPDKTRIVYVSRMDEDRSFAAHKLIEAAPELDTEIPDLEIVIVGGGNDFEPVLREAEAVNMTLGKRLIITTGSRTDINQFVAGGDLFVGVSRAALEAMACEKPAIIAGNEGYIGIFDQDKLQISIDTNFCCRGCDATTAQKLKQDILTVLKAPSEERERLGAYARQVVKERYSVDTMADDAMKMYVSIVKNSRINQVTKEEFQDIDAYLQPNPAREKSGAADVMISGYYGFNNSGDDSILKAMIQSLVALKPNIRIVALSNNPQETTATYGVDATHRFNFPRIAWQLRKTQLLISGGGSLIQDVTSDKSLAYYLGIIRLGKAMGAKVMLYANGIGPIGNPANHHKIQKVLNQTDLITLRENASVDELHRFGVTVPRIVVTADPAFTLTPANPEETEAILEKTGLPAGVEFCGIAVRPWEKLDDDFVKSLGYIADYIKREYDLELLFIPMQTAKDTPISQKIMDTMEQQAYLLKEPVTPSQILGIVNKAQFILAMRLHTLIYAAKMSTPVIGLVYDPKVAAMMDYMGQSYQMPANHINPVTMCRYIDEIMLKHEEISAQLAVLSTTAAAKATENAQLAIALLGAKD